MRLETEKILRAYLRLYKKGEVEEVFMVEQINTLMQKASNTDIIGNVSCTVIDCESKTIDGDGLKALNHAIEKGSKGKPTLKNRK